MKAYKGFSKDMICRGFQYEEGKTYETDHAVLCEKGFHACIDPLDIFSYYPPGEECVYHEVEMSGELDDGNWYELYVHAQRDTKVCCTNITIGKRLKYYDIYNAHYELIKNNSKDTFLLSRSPSLTNIVFEDHTHADLDGMDGAGDNARVVAGYYNAINMNFGCNLIAENCNTIYADYCAKVCIGSNNFVIAGDQSNITACKSNYIKAGNNCRITSGAGSVAIAGDNSIVIVGGIASVGFRSCATAYGAVPKASGGLESILTLEKFSYIAPARKIATKTVVVDGKTVIPHRWYTLDDEGNLIKTTCAIRRM